MFGYFCYLLLFVVVVDMHFFIILAADFNYIYLQLFLLYMVTSIDLCTCFYMQAFPCSCARITISYIHVVYLSLKHFHEVIDFNFNLYLIQNIYEYKI